MSSDQTIREIRLGKLAEMRDLGMDPYAVETWDSPKSVKELLDGFAEGEPVSLGGRVVSYRQMGKAGFAHLSDGDNRMQIYVRRDDVGDVAWSAYKLLDIGDHVGVKGELFLTKSGERSIHVRELVPLSKAIEPIPIGKEKDGHTFSGLTDVEIRYRHRHLDLIANQQARQALINRAKITRAVRNYFDDHGYIEVETPILQLEAGGAAATPFLTHYNAYDIDVKLRISLELYLKRLICGDLPRVYEIGRVFRNEGISNRHNPEFTLLEFYESYGNLETMMMRVEECFRSVSEEVFGTHLIEMPSEVGDIQDQDSEGDAVSVRLDFGRPWRRVHLLEEIERHTGLTAADLSDLGTAISAINERQVMNPLTGKRIVMDEERNLGGLIEKLLEVFVEPTLQEPTFVVGYPIETSPLAKRDTHNPRMTRRFEGYVLGREVCNAFSEINDPIDQRERFEQQLNERSKGDHEAHPMDEEFLYALECGMPPTGGCGIGIDRMAMLLTGCEHIREIMFFPFMRPLVDTPSDESA